MRLLVISAAAVALLGFASELRAEADIRNCAVITARRYVRNDCDFPITIRVEPARDDFDADIVEQVLRPGEERRLWPRWTFTVLRRATSADLRPSPYPANPD
jgi:hypothetical protein